MALQIVMVLSSFVACWENDPEFSMHPHTVILESPDMKLLFAGRMCKLIFPDLPRGMYKDLRFKSS